MRFQPDEDLSALLSALDRVLRSDAAGWRVAPDHARHAWSPALDAQLEASGFFEAAAEPSLGPVAAAELTRRVAGAPALAEAGASALLRPLALAAGAPDLPRPLAVTAGTAPGAAIPFLPVARAVLRIAPNGVDAAALAPGDAATVPSLFAYPMGRLVREPDWTRLSVSPDAALARWRVALAAELAGALQGGLDAVVAHVTERRQFGRPLGSFQGVQHRLAATAARVEGARLLALRAAQDLCPADAPEALGHAQRIAGEAVYDLHQFMGAMGLTLEHPLHRWTYRARWLRGALGGAEANLAAAADLRWAAA
ncbi:MAG: acyl-CoA dehydrogenase family protein [Pseudomonadota bacterium]|nr:acyl-CoA dehydrogenase family protein [Pseudomonadota bacterium]MEE3101565.1 acyl-CoA dehydrogenase family protein [Pseudomonadota bacterium]